MLRKDDPVEQLKKLADATGYDCTGPATSLVKGSMGITGLFRLFGKAERCIANTEAGDTILRANPKIKKELEDLVIEAEIGGACRFWQKNDKDTFKQAKDCEKIFAEIAAAQRAAYEGMGKK